MDIEKAKKLMKFYIENYNDTMYELFKIVLLELEKKDKVINEMAECIGQDIRCVRPEIECNKMTHDCRECIKEYFTNKAENVGE